MPPRRRPRSRSTRPPLEDGIHDPGKAFRPCRDVADLDSVTAFFGGLGLAVEGRSFVDGEFLETVIGIP
jgi:hypothetical protein